MCEICCYPIYSCPVCKTEVSQYSGYCLKSSRINTLYSDMFIKADLDFDITKCEKCNTFFFLNNENNTNRFEPYFPSFFLDGPPVLSVYDFIEVGKSAICNTKKRKLFFALQVLWNFNDRILSNEKLFQEKDDELLWKENNETVLQLLKHEIDEHKIMIAEINRYFKDFDKCIEIINELSDNYYHVKKKFINACKHKNRFVIKIDRIKFQL